MIPFRDDNVHQKKQFSGNDHRWEIPEGIGRGAPRLLLYRNSGADFNERWPKDYVNCELNLPVWRKLVSECKITGDAEEVLEGMENGFHQGIPDHTLGNRRWYTPKNHDSARLAAEKIFNTLMKEKREGRIFGPFTHKEVFKKIGFFILNPMGSVTNGDGSFRVINDLSFPHDDPDTPSVNSFVDKKEFETSWDDFKVIIKFFKNNKGKLQAAIYDWAKAYRQIAILISQWRFLMIMDLRNQMWVDTRIQFGGVAGCGVFGRRANLWRAIVVKIFSLEAAFRWVDDNLLIKEGENPKTVGDIVALSNKMGVASNSEKVHEFADEQRYIGFIWNVVERTVRLPDEKLEQHKNKVDEFLAPGTAFNLKRAEKFIGRLVHTTYIVPNLKCYMPSLHRWEAEWKVPAAERKIPGDVRDDLLEWQSVLKSFVSRRIIPDEDPVDVEWVGDASMKGIGVLIGKKWAEFTLVRGWNEIETSRGERNIAWAETVAIRLGIIMISKLQGVGGKTFKVLTDNTTSEAAVEKRKSGDHAVNKEWKAIQRLLFDLHCDIVAERVATGDNLADKLSRGKDNRDVNNRVVIDVPTDLKLVVKQVL